MVRSHVLRNIFNYKKNIELLLNAEIIYHFDDSQM